jgi:hypothetical protein
MGVPFAIADANPALKPKLVYVGGDCRKSGFPSFQDYLASWDYEFTKKLQKKELFIIG